MDNSLIYFKEPRFLFTTPERFLIRLVTCSVYILLAVMSLLFLASDIQLLFWLGVFFVLFLVHRALHVRGGELTVLYASRNIKKGKKVNLALLLSRESRLIIELALDKASLIHGNPFLYMLQKLSENKGILEALNRLSITKQVIGGAINEAFEKNKEAYSKEIIFRDIEELIRIAFPIAERHGEHYIEPRELFRALYDIKNKALEHVFVTLNIEKNDIEGVLVLAAFKKFGRQLLLPRNIQEFSRYQRSHLRHSFMNRAWTARPTRTLDHYGRDLTDLARLHKVGFLIGHEAEYNRVINALSRPYKPSALLVGDPGVGKEAIVHHLAFALAKDHVPAELFDKRLVKLDLGRLVSSGTPQELQERIATILDEIVSAGNVILYIPDIDNLVKTSGVQYMSAADAFLPAVSDGRLSVVGATYPKEFRELIEPQTDFVSSFEVIRVPEISEEETKKLLVYESLILEKEFKIMITLRAIYEAVRIAHQYIRSKPLPGSADELLKEALVYSRHRGEKILTPELVVKSAERESNVPIHAISKDEAQKLLNLENKIHTRLIDQEDAVRAVSNALRQYRSGLTRKGSPIASFLFVGPTGVGKTELSKILALIQFGSKDAMIRFDMAEYQEKESIRRFIGSPNGSQGGTLTEAITQKPYGILLLDEFEKTHPDILNLFLAVFDDGRLTDSLHRTVSFENVIIIATSNAHSDFIKSSLEEGRPMSQISDELKKKLTTYFKPELINRFSDIIVIKTDIKNLLAEKILKNEVVRGGSVRIVVSGDTFSVE